MDNNVENLKNIPLDLSVLETLSPAEKELALSILSEYSEKGKSDLYTQMLLEDFNEIPVDILTFVDNNNYLGYAWHDNEGKSKLYPYWRKELTKIFPDNLTTNINNAILSGSRGRGKAQPLDSLIFTETGYRNMGDLKVGDNVYGSDGKIHTILGIFPQGKKPIYEVTFSDHSKTKCSDEHLWCVRDNDDMSWKTVELKDMLAGSLIRKSASNSIKECRYKIPLTSPLEFENKNTFISPYLMGCLIGDGCFSRSISLTTKDDKILNYMISELDQHDHTVSVDRCSYMIKRKQKRNIPNNYIEYIRKLGLYKHTAELKFIPDIYLFNDIDSRIELLQGLLDTDGTITQDGSSITYSTCSKKLAEQVMFLVHTLGGTASIREEVNLTYKYKGVITPCKDCFTVALKLPRSITPFKLTRKINRINPRSLEPQRNIKEITYIGEEECQCIYIDSTEHLYLTDNLIVTHNTEIAVLMATYLLHRILCLKDPIAYFHLKPTEKIVFAFMNIKKDLAEEIGNTKFQNTIQSSPWFLSHGTIEGRTNKVWVPQKFNNQEAVDIKIGSQADDLLGLPVYFCFCLDGDTLIKTSEGIKSLYECEDKQIQVATINDDGEEYLSDYCTVKCTGESSVEYEVELEDGTKIKCTPNHQFMLKSGAYKRADELTEEDELFDNKMYGYIYKTTNLINGKQYIGQHKASNFEFDTYKGSGKILQKAFNKYGKTNFKTELLTSDGKVPTICQTKEELNFAEKYYIGLYECVEKSTFYNYAPGGSGGDIYSALPDKAKLERNSNITRSLLKTFSDKDEQYYRNRAIKKANTLSKLSEEERLARKEAASKVQQQLNKTRTFEQKALISKHHREAIKHRTAQQEIERKQKERLTKASKSEEEKKEYREKLSKANRGKRKYTDGTHVIYTYPGTELAGYTLGGGNLNKYKYYYYFQDKKFNGKQELFIQLKKLHPSIKLSNIQSIIDGTKQAQRKFPELIGKILKEER